MFDRFGLLEPYRPLNKILTLNQNSIYLGDLSAAMDIVNLKVNNIKSILSIVHNSDLHYSEINHKVILIKDKPHIDIFQYFTMANEFIDQALQLGSILVHCSMGISRSPTIVIAYVMMKFKYPFSKAYNLVRKKRPIICPNFGFTFQLKQYERICIQPKLMPEVVYREFCPPIKESRSISMQQPASLFINQQQSDRKTVTLNLSANSERKVFQQKRKIVQGKDKHLPKLQPTINFVSFNMIKEYAEELKSSRLNPSIFN